VWGKKGGFNLIRRFKVSVGNKAYEVAIEEIGGASQKDAPSQPTPINRPPKAENTQTPKQQFREKTEGCKTEAVVCPMPARVISIKCRVGERVEAGETLIVIEAMKMEHPLCAPKDGVILEIKTVEGASVAYNQPLIIIG
jgi:biotin carboxyl carrier protein